MSEADFGKYNVFFQGTGKPYVGKLLEKMIADEK